MKRWLRVNRVNITLTYAPFWYGLSLVIEYMYGKVDAATLVLVLGLRSEDIEAQFQA